MKNSSGRPAKRVRLFELRRIGIHALEHAGWRVEKVRKPRGASLRRISRGGESKLISIRTTQDTYIAFNRNEADNGFVTLSDVDAVVAVSVDDRENPKFALVHMLDGEDMRKRFDRTWKARHDAGQSIPTGQGVWLSLYRDEATSPAHLVGAGAGNETPAFSRVPLDHCDESADAAGAAEAKLLENEDKPLTIAEAKTRLAQALGVDAGSIRIIVEG